ncbi:hypothetical protein K0T92_04555 [Paenibacillus oenotherae]|uniref:Uncharacterized protein n=1 Tax=Paenibacillus oenotherae TaxID=1435645 RepID=A0ABS7D273_9BACL|nr:hypothetical protein [Paenibacillus oenotherae]MBW7474003.1 hypothetical protein [Paenibacillus oenotherae]
MSRIAQAAQILLSESWNDRLTSWLDEPNRTSGSCSLWRTSLYIEQRRFEESLLVENAVRHGILRLTRGGTAAYSD